MADIALVGWCRSSRRWGDGHGTGFYTFELLRDACACDECLARRAARSPEPGLPSHESHAS
jgi:hypothetical protein